MASNHDTSTVAQPISNLRQTLHQDKRLNPNIGIRIKTMQNDFPRSHAANWTPPVPVTSEHVAIEALKDEWRRHPESNPTYDRSVTRREVLIAELYDFEIYRSPDAGHQARRFELMSLHHLEVPTAKKLCLDGFLCIGDVRFYVQRLVIQDLSVEGYGDNESPSVITYVQSEKAKKDVRYDIWFRLGNPSQEYKRFHDPFLWVAQLGKHVLDFMEEQPARSVRLETFRKDFCSWLVSRYHHSVTLQDWHQAYRGRIDFRTGVNAYVDFIYHQAFNLPGSKQLLAHPLWADCMVRGMTAIKMQDQTVQQTLATPHVHNCFKDMYFGDNIRAIAPALPVMAKQELRKAQLRFPKSPASIVNDAAPWRDPPCHSYNSTPIEVGDVVAFNPTKEEKEFWRSSHWQWFAYVQRIERRENRVQRLFVLYLYRPRETNIFKAKYPFENELFFSNNCNCTEGELLSTEITGRCEVEWLPSVLPTKSFFIRQSYVTQDSAFVTLTEAHKVCNCLKTKPPIAKGYQPGDTAYITKTVHGQKILEPVVLRSIDTGSVMVRRLLRLGRDCAHMTPRTLSNIAANELVLTDQYETLSASRLQRRCYVRFVSKQDLLLGKVPFPYSRGGAGDLWILSMGLATSKDQQRLIYLARLPDRFREGPDLSLLKSSQQLKGLSIFSGGGSLDRGLQEGGAVDFQTVVDFSPQAMHTQRANMQDPSQVRLFCGSVDDYLKLALNGKQHELIALIGAVNFVLAGAPCPGFSTLQQRFLSEDSIRNASHISTFCSFVEYYLPEFAILENVTSMAFTRTGFEDQNVLSQLVACLVSLGYQVNQYIMDAWNYGSAQHRSRVFLTIAAPGLEPMIQPYHTHSRPSGDTVGKSLGRLPNGQRFGEREYYATPFAHVSAGAVTWDLPNIGNGNVQSCISHPDHRISYQPARKERALLKCIPRHPPGSGYTEAFRLGLIPSSLLKPGKETGKAYRRIEEAGLIPTITTGQSIQDSRNGAVVHWFQDRPITVMEARRTQGWPDEEPIIGSLTEQYKIVGNGVDRKVSFALGLALRRIVEQNAKRSKVDTAPVRAPKKALVDADEDSNDSAYLASNIHMHVPPQSRVTARTTAAAILDPSSSSSNLLGLNEDDVAEIPDISELDATLDPHDTETGTDEHAEVITRAPSFMSRVSATVSSGLGALVFRSRASLSVPATPASHGKRGLEEASINGVYGPSYSNSNETITRKRARVGDNTSVTRHTPVRLKEVELKKRNTRHSGLEVTFQPTQWNKKPEYEYGAGAS